MNRILAGLVTMLFLGLSSSAMSGPACWDSCVARGNDSLNCSAFCGIKTHEDAKFCRNLCKAEKQPAGLCDIRCTSFKDTSGNGGNVPPVGGNGSYGASCWNGCLGQGYGYGVCSSRCQTDNVESEGICYTSCVQSGTDSLTCSNSCSPY